MSKTHNSLKSVTSYTLSAVLLIVSILLLRIACDTATWRWQVWYFKSPSTATNSIIFSDKPIKSHDELVVFAGVILWYKDEGYPVRLTDLSQDTVPIWKKLLIAEYTDELFWPYGFFVTALVSACTAMFAAATLATFIIAERCPFPTVRTPVTPTLLLRISFTSVVFLPLCGIVALYFSFDRTGMVRAYGTYPYTALLWNVIMWPTVIIAQTLFGQLLHRHTHKIKLVSKCARCGYPTQGLHSVVCPECGTSSSWRPIAWASRSLCVLGIIIGSILVVNAMLGARATLVLEQPNKFGIVGPNATFTDRLSAWCLLSPVAPVTWRATVFGD